MKLNTIVTALFLIAGLQSAHAQFIDLEFPEPEAVGLSEVYRCTADPAGKKGGAVVSIKGSKFWLLEHADSLTGLPMKISDIKTARCPHTYMFKVDMMGEETSGSLSGCAGGDITLTLESPDMSKLELTCTYQP